MSVIVRRVAGGRGRLAEPEQALAVQILNAMALPVVVLDARNRFRHTNPAAEEFLGMSAPHLLQLALSDLVPGDNPIFLLIDHVRQAGVTVSDHDLTLESPRLAKRGITVQISPMLEEAGAVDRKSVV